jgi:hypothetical protein
MGYEKLLTSLYGSTPQIDLDRQIARVRVPKPVTFDFKALGEGVIKNNMGVGELRFEANVDIRDGKVVIQPTGQTFPLRGTAQPGWRKFRVLDWKDPAKTTLEAMN